MGLSVLDRVYSEKVFASLHFSFYGGILHRLDQLNDAGVPWSDNVLHCSEAL